MHLQDHVRLSRAQPDVADQHIADGLHLPGLRAHRELVRAARGNGGQRRVPASALVGLRSRSPARQRNAQRFARCASPHTLIGLSRCRTA